MPSTPYQYLTTVAGNAEAKLDFTGTTGTGHAQIEFAYISQGLTPSAAADANTWFTVFNTNLGPYISDLVTFSKVEIVLWDGTNFQEAISTHAPVIGGQTGALLPPNVAMLMKKKTAGLGKQNRGRVYLPGVSESLLSAPDTISTTNWNLMNTAATAFFNALIADELQPNIRRKTQNPALNHQINCNGFMFEQLLATQRRRLRKAAHR
jgi:hypothetical protein